MTQVHGGLEEAEVHQGPEEGLPLLLLPVQPTLGICSSPPLPGQVGWAGKREELRRGGGCRQGGTLGWACGCSVPRHVIHRCGCGWVCMCASAYEYMRVCVCVSMDVCDCMHAYVCVCARADVDEW